MYNRYGALLCDVDGILRLWPKDGMSGVDRAYGLPEGTLAGTAFHPDHLLPAITGRVSDQEWREGIALALADRCGGEHRARLLVADWTAIRPGVDEDIVALLTNTRRRIPVVLVTNATTRFESDLADLGLTGVANAIVNSSRVGVAKPEPGIYRIAAERAGVPVEDCLFTDDTEANVTAAREHGLNGLHYRHVDELRAILDGTGAEDLRVPGPRLGRVHRLPGQVDGVGHASGDRHLDNLHEGEPLA